jgi:hypothetical protein
MGTAKKTVKEVIPLLSATCTIQVNVMSESEGDEEKVVQEIGKKRKMGITLIDKDYKSIKLVEHAGFIVPSNYPNAQVRCVMTALGDAAFFSLVSRDMDRRTEVDKEKLKKVGFPLKSLAGIPFPAKSKRSEVVSNTVAKMCQDKKYAAGIVKMMIDPTVQFDAQRGVFKVTSPKVLKAKTVAQMYIAISAWRDVRGADGDARSDVTAAY